MAANDVQTHNPSGDKAGAEACNDMRLVWLDMEMTGLLILKKSASSRWQLW